MSGAERRKKIIAMIREASAPLSGGALGKATGVSRQIVVQDVMVNHLGYGKISAALNIKNRRDVQHFMANLRPC